MKKKAVFSAEKQNENKPATEKNMSKKGLQLSEEYFQAYGVDMLKKMQIKYPELQGMIAAGLAGQGSECFGFDDSYSQDHDFGPAFCIWLPENLYRKYAKPLQEAYENLPKEFAGYPARNVTVHAQERVGVLCIEDFYYRLTGKEGIPESNLEWLRIPESGLSKAVNGKIFLDELGEFTSIREGLLKYYPEDVRLKKIVARAAGMAQSGQYNYARMMRRGEYTAAFLAVSEFIKNACSMVHLLNRRYTPFYKWMHRSLKDMKILPEVYDLIAQLSAAPCQSDAWKEVKEEDLIYGLNLKDGRVVLMETIAQLVIKELHRQELSDVQDSYLDHHTFAMMKKIKDPVISSLQILEG